MTDPVDPYPQAPWGEHPLPGEEPACRQFGPLNLWCKSMGNEVWIARKGATGEAEPDEGFQPLSQDAQAWSRWALDHAYHKMELLPVFPDRPVVVKPEVPFHLLRNGGKATIYIRVPLWVRLNLLRGDTRVTLVEVPIVTLSDTWFGSYVGGELCYWISSGVRRDLDLATSRPHLATCTVHIRNESNDNLHVDKICLAVAHLSLFSRKACLFADEATINFEGAQQNGGFSVLGAAPFADAVPISAPRTPTKPDFSARALLSFIS